MVYGMLRELVKLGALDRILPLGATSEGDRWVRVTGTTRLLPRGSANPRNRPDRTADVVSPRKRNHHSARSCRPLSRLTLAETAPRRRDSTENPGIVATRLPLSTIHQYRLPSDGAIFNTIQSVRSVVLPGEPHVPTLSPTAKRSPRGPMVMANA